MTDKEILLGIEITLLKEEIEDLRTALEFYSDPDPHPQSNDYKSPEVAKEALRKLDD